MFDHGLTSFLRKFFAQAIWTSNPTLCPSTHLNRQRAREVKGLDLKSNGLRPHRFKPCRCRLFIYFHIKIYQCNTILRDFLRLSIFCRQKQATAVHALDLVAANVTDPDLETAVAAIPATALTADKHYLRRDMFQFDFLLFSQQFD